MEISRCSCWEEDISQYLCSEGGIFLQNGKIEESKAILKADVVMGKKQLQSAYIFTGAGIRRRIFGFFSDVENETFPVGGSSGRSPDVLLHFAPPFSGVRSPHVLQLDHAFVLVVVPDELEPVAQLSGAPLLLHFAAAALPLEFAVERFESPDAVFVVRVRLAQQTEIIKLKL